MFWSGAESRTTTQCYSTTFIVYLRKNYPSCEVFWSVFSQIQTEYGSKSPYSVQTPENTDQKNSECGYSLRHACSFLHSLFLLLFRNIFMAWHSIRLCNQYYLKNRHYLNVLKLIFFFFISY